MTESELVQSMERELEGKEFVPLKINSIDELKEFLMIARGQDPDSQQTLNRFLDFSNPIERSNLPTMTDVMRVSYLDFLSDLYYPNDPNNPFRLAAVKQSQALMARKGEKSQQFVDMTKQTPSAIDLTSVENATKRGIVDRALGRGKTE